MLWADRLDRANKQIGPVKGRAWDNATQKRRPRDTDGAPDESYKLV
jgi:hypothetical protein